MSILHMMSLYAKGPISGRQGTQRDFSPYVAHFTSANAMRDLVEAIESQHEWPKDIATKLDDADRESWTSAMAILRQDQITAGNCGYKSLSWFPKSVCFTECTLPGLLSHCERYGRFGFVFKKQDLFGVGARPCTYVDSNTYARNLEVARDGDATKRKRFALTNKYAPWAQSGAMDYSQEREWRLVGDLDLRGTPPVAILCPEGYANKVKTRTSAHVFPIEMLFEWGA